MDNDPRDGAGNSHVQALGMLASALAGRPVGVSPLSAGEPSWTDGRTIFLDPSAPPGERTAAVAVHASLIAAVMLGMGRVRRIEGGDALRAHDREQLTERVLALLELCLADFGAPDPDDP